MRTLPLGPFDVTEPVGRGGMGSVWRGLHRDSGVPVAVKVLHRPSGRDGGTPQSFLDETRAVAGLDHPGVVWVFDTGVVDADTAVRSNGLMQARSPWLAMEFASGGTLSDVTPQRWEEVRGVLEELLSALGHAHSRGVVHRDLKPGNVLSCSLSDLRPGLKLTDFGIAAALEETVDRSMAQGLVGTLAYMAPEQIRSDWREFGPWTDLYALGCLVYRMVGNQRPFRDQRGPALVTAHLTQRPQPLVPRVPVPALFAEWLDALMQKHPRDRFQSAAEAARMLAALGPPVPLESDRPGPIEEGPTNLALDRSTEVAGLRRAVDPRATLPADWRSTEAPWPPPRLLGAGLGLLGLRAIPMVAREEERDRAWRVLQDVMRSGRGRVLVLRGSVGVGKTRVARWIGEAAHALGGLTYLLGEARADEAPEEVLIRPFRRWFRTVRLGPDERLRRLERGLGLPADDPLVRDAAALLAAPGETGPQLEGEARHAVARRLLERVAGRRPLVLVLDDAQHSPEALRFARHLAEAQAVAPLPVLVVSVVADESVSADPHLVQELGELLQRPGVVSLHLDPLPPAALEQVLRGLLPLERGLGATLAERTAGNPLHAVELVKSWVSRGALVRGEGGFELREGDAGVLALASVWRSRVEEVLAGLPAVAGELLELAAALGSPVDEDEWQRVCDDPKARYAAQGQVRFVPEHAVVRNELRTRLLVRHLAEESDDRWGFVHEMLREAILDRAREAGRLERHHRACARALLHREDARRQAERIGRHLLLGGRGEPAVPHLLAGFRRRRRATGDATALPLLGILESALRSAEVPDQDPRWIELAVRRAETFVRLEQTADAERFARKAAAEAAAIGATLLESRALVALGRCAMMERDPGTADELLARAEELVGNADEPRWCGELHAARAECARLLGDRQRSRGHSTLAFRFLSELGERSNVAQAWSVVAEAASFQGDLPTAERAWERARGLFARGGHPAREADCLAALGQLARRAGDLERARVLIGQAVEGYRRCGSARLLHGVLASARLHLARREWDDARRVVGEAVTGAETARPGPVELQVHAVLLTASAGLRDWSAFDVHLEQVRRLLVPPTDPELTFCLELAEARASAARETVRAEALAALIGGSRSPLLQVDPG